MSRALFFNCQNSTREICPGHRCRRDRPGVAAANLRSHLGSFTTAVTAAMTTIEDNRPRRRWTLSWLPRYCLCWTRKDWLLGIWTTPIVVLVYHLLLWESLTLVDESSSLPSRLDHWHRCIMMYNEVSLLLHIGIYWIYFDNTRCLYYITYDPISLHYTTLHHNISSSDSKF